MGTPSVIAYSLASLCAGRKNPGFVFVQFGCCELLGLWDGKQSLWTRQLELIREHWPPDKSWDLGSVRSLSKTNSGQWAHSRGCLGFLKYKACTAVSTHSDRKVCAHLSVRARTLKATKTCWVWPCPPCPSPMCVGLAGYYESKEVWRLFVTVQIEP